MKQPIKEIAQLCRARKVFLHTDAAQAVGKVRLLIAGWHPEWQQALQSRLVLVVLQPCRLACSSCSWLMRCQP